MTDTPETDDLARGNHVVPTEFAEQLERRRDEWKAKYLQQNKDLGHELLDPNGTIWGECKRLQIELTAVTEQRDNAIEMGNRTRDNSGAIIASQVVENIILTQQRDRLAEALEYILGIGLTEKTKAKAEKALKNND